MNKQVDTAKGPGVYIPPPLFYVLIFIAALRMQKIFPISRTLFQRTVIMNVTGAILIVMALYFLGRSLRQFFRTKNTLILIKPALSLQRTGIYGLSRNPMYV